MGYWTSVIATFEAGWINGTSDVDAAIGKHIPDSLLYYDNGKRRETQDELEYAFTHEDEYVPVGADGTLQVNICLKRDGGAIVNVYGNLENAPDVVDIKEWFNRSCDRFRYLHQAMCIVVDPYNCRHVYVDEVEEDDEDGTQL